MAKIREIATFNLAKVNSIKVTELTVINHFFAFHPRGVGNGSITQTDVTVSLTTCQGRRTARSATENHSRLLLRAQLTTGKHLNENR